MRWISKFFELRQEKEEREPAGKSSPVQNSEGSARALVTGDNPIWRPDDDGLERIGAAVSFSHQALALDSSEGAVVGVLGAWGSGKTSFINLARNEFAQNGVAILDFNPWMFSGAEQLVESFFIELAAQLRLRSDMAEIGERLNDYGEAFAGMAWLPLAGPWIERSRGAAKILSKVLQRRKEGIGGRRERLVDSLSSLDKPIVIVLDDIDRLSTNEIRDIFKLVRLTASFPNVIYVLAFDRTRVEEALAEQGVPGRDYLEKILQVAVDLPFVPDHVLNHQIFKSLDEALSSIEKPGPFDETVWPDVFTEIVQPLIRNIRDVRRYAAAVHGTVRSLSGQIALSDVLALEAIRVFLPDVFLRLHGAVEGLTKTSSLSLGVREEPPCLETQVKGLIEAAGDSAEVVRAMVYRLFPAAERHIGASHYGPDWLARWLRERRVAHEDILRLYLERVAGTGLKAFTDAEQAWLLMANRHALEDHLRSIDPERLEDVIGSLEVYEDNFKAEQVVPATVALLNILPDIPDRPRDIFDFGGHLRVTRVTYRLIRSLNDPIKIENAVREILPEVNTLSAKFEIIKIVGYREGAGHKLVTEGEAEQLEKEWREEVLTTRVDSLDLNREYDLFRVYFFVKTERANSEAALTISNDPRLVFTLLRTAKSEATSQTMGSRAVRRHPRLAWDSLVELFDGEGNLKNRISNLRAADLDGCEDLIQLADKYLDGWRPSNFGDDE